MSQQLPGAPWMLIHCLPPSHVSLLRGSRHQAFNTGGSGIAVQLITPFVARCLLYLVKEPQFQFARRRVDAAE